MTDKYKDYLAGRVLSDGKPVTYRLLSRAVTVNVNTAKQMLYDFHTTQNAKKPKSVHATYLLTGRKPTTKPTNGTNKRDGEDIVMQSSPYMSSMPNPGTQEEEEADEPVPETCVELVREEELESTKAQFEEITSIHIYSLEPGPLENLTLLSVCNREIAKEFSNDDPLDRWRLYGSIHNPHIERRTAKSAPAPTDSSSKVAPKIASKTAPKVKSEPTAPAKKGSASEDATSVQSKFQPTSNASTLKKSDSKPNLKREKSDIFKSFAKAKAKPKEAAKSKDSTPAPTEDEPMQGMSEDEGGDEDVPEVKFDEEKAAQARKARTEREERLRQMMEESDEEMPDATPAEETASPGLTPEVAPAKQAEPEAVVTASGGRKRGRRLVTKKKKVKDEEGYLVTKEEKVWESFSEDEAPPKKLKPAAKPAPNTAKKTGKAGQGSIANFFKKA